jgi:hypothetical protein
VHWEASSSIFFHRSEIVQFVSLLQSDVTHAFIPVTFRKLPTSEFITIEGGEVFGTGLMDISCLVSSQYAGEIRFPMIVTGSSLQGDGFLEVNSQLEIVFRVNAPFLPKTALNTLESLPPPANNHHHKHTNMNDHENNRSPIMNEKIPQLSKIPVNRDVIQELRDEIANTLEYIAQEYVSLYPRSLNETVDMNNNNHSNSHNNSHSNSSNNIVGNNHEKKDATTLFEEQKIAFMHYLANSGVFFDLQEKMRNKIQLYIHDIYGRKGRALGKSILLREKDSSLQFPQDDEEEQDTTTTNNNNNNNMQQMNADVQAILSEVYTMIMKECNIVLNAMFGSTILQKQALEVEQPMRFIDEEESIDQTFQRIYLTAIDAAADEQYLKAEQLHLERLQYLDHSSKLAVQPDYYHQAYADYAVFLLEYGQHILYQHSCLSSFQQQHAYTMYTSLLQKARLALKIAKDHDTNQTHWEMLLLYIMVLMECDQWDTLPDLFQEILFIQQQQQASQQRSSKKTSLQMNSWNEFTGYETDELPFIHPRYYTILAIYFTRLSQTSNNSTASKAAALNARKALRLALRAFDYDSSGRSRDDPAIMGKPRRTLVLILGETADYLLHFGQIKSAQLCVQLAMESEMAATAKAQARDKPAITPPHIKYLLKKIQAENLWNQSYWNMNNNSNNNNNNVENNNRQTTDDGE